MIIKLIAFLREQLEIFFLTFSAAIYLIYPQRSFTSILQNQLDYTFKIFLWQLNKSFGSSRTVKYFISVGEEGKL